MSYQRKKLSDFEFVQTTYLGGKISKEHKEYKDLSMKDTDEQFAKWIIENASDLSNKSPEEAICEILDVHSKLVYLQGCTEITQMAMKLGDLSKDSSARGLRQLLAQSRD